MDYYKLISYYVTSDEWAFQTEEFLDSFRHRFAPGEEVGREGQPDIISDVYLKYYRKVAVDGGYPNPQLTPMQFEKYFDEHYSDEQRFATVFGLWWGLEDQQISQISDLRQKHRCLKWLNYFICEPGTDNIRLPDLEAWHYTGRYFQALESGRQTLLLPIQQILPDGKIVYDVRHECAPFYLNELDDLSRSYGEITNSWMEDFYE